MRRWIAGVVFMTAAGVACTGEGTKPTGIELPTPSPSPRLQSFETVTEEAWDETAVRKVLHVFAFGGFASDEQIRIWADMSPHDAITEMFTFDETNRWLAPSDGAFRVPSGRLGTLSDHWSSDASSNFVSAEDREQYRKDNWDSPARVWAMAAAKTGLNPVRQRIGLFETNYHLAVNQDGGVSNRQIFRYYDDIMDALAADMPYQGVLAIAAQSAAVATQYNHRKNRFVDARFEGNEDFGREIHQLYFGILGAAEPEYHELTTIRNTSKALTDMPVERVGAGDNERPDDVVTFGTKEHFPGPLEILHANTEGPTAKERIVAITELAVSQQESLENLPVLIVRGLADDNLDDERIATIRGAWAEMNPKSLLTFLRNYAVSTTFHHPNRVKYWSSVERNVRNSNLVTAGSHEAYAHIYDPISQMGREGVRIFRPLRNVFGGQTGLDASTSGSVFREAYNQSTERNYVYGATEDNATGWVKDWSRMIPAGPDGTRRVRGIADWLWQRLIADGWKNFGTLERAHVYALLGAGLDFATFVNDQEPFAVYSAADIETRPDLVELVADMEVAVVALNTVDNDERMTANRRVGMAVNFILATPYAFAQEGK